MPFSDPELTRAVDRRLTWAETKPGHVWRTLDDRYAIVAHTLPENPPQTVYQARKIDPAMTRAHPTRGDLGTLLDESPWQWNTANDVHSAEAACERDAFCDAHPGQRDVPADYPAAASERFFWPISDGTTRGALAVIVDSGRILARVIGMHRGGDRGFEPGFYAEIDVTGLTEHGVPTTAPAPMTRRRTFARGVSRALRIAPRFRRARRVDPPPLVAVMFDESGTRLDTATQTRESP